jgi:inorganic pyrophosphatase
MGSDENGVNGKLKEKCPNIQWVWDLLHQFSTVFDKIIKFFPQYKSLIPMIDLLYSIIY